MTTQLSSREKLLATVVGAVVLVLLNLFVISFFIKNHRRLSSELVSKTAELRAMQSLLADKAMWAEREAWLKQAQPKLEGEGKARTDLLDDIKKIARQANVQLLKQEFGSLERKPQYVSVPVSIEAKATKEAVRDFLVAMQDIDRFIVFEHAKLQFDTEDKTLMGCEFRIAKWFAPK
jgi:Tfp pilus assembly protein PilO